MKIDFWFDPVCPWCWVTSRWLVNDVAPQRNLEINWRPISLLFKNKMDQENPFFERATHTHGLMRVFLAVKETEGSDLAAKFYTAAGMAIHNGENQTVTATELLKEIGASNDHAAAYKDESWDEKIRSEMNEGLELVGEDVGTPIIAFDSEAGRKGIFGPVISKVPTDKEQSLKIWDAVVTISEMDEFWELKRTRTVGPDFTF